MNLLPKNLFGKGNGAQSFIVAGILGIAAAYVVAKSNILGGTPFNITGQPPVTAQAMQAAGMMPVFSRGFPDQSIKHNVVPSASMGIEMQVPFDSSGRWSKVTGAYDRCDAQIF
jgi:hypothetical protein